MGKQHEYDGGQCWCGEPSTAIHQDIHGDAEQPSSSVGDESPRPALAKRILGALLPCLFSGFVVIGMCYVLKLLIQASPPEIGVGVIGGLIWSFFFAKAWQLFKWTLEDAETAFNAPERETETTTVE